MKSFAKSFVAALTGTTMLAGLALGEEVTATKKAPLQSILPNSYGSVEVRQTTFRYTANDEVTKDRSVLQVYPTLGSTWFDGNLDTQLILGVQRKTAEMTVTEVRPEIYSEATVFSSTYAKIVPYLDIFTPFAGSGTDASLSLYSEANAPIETIAGKITLIAAIDPNMTVASRAAKATAADRIGNDRRSEFGLAQAPETGDVEVEQREPSYETAYIGKVSLNPALLPNLKLTTASYVVRDFAPKYVQELEDNEPVQTKVGYTGVTFVQHRYTVAYDFGNGLVLGNQLRHNINGFYESRKNQDDGKSPFSNRYENRLYLTYKAF